MMVFGANLQFLSRTFRIALRHVNMSNQGGRRFSPRGLRFSQWAPRFRPILRFSQRGLRFSPWGLRFSPWGLRVIPWVLDLRSSFLGHRFRNTH